jgi:hypothetical protein
MQIVDAILHWPEIAILSLFIYYESRISIILLSINKLLEIINYLMEMF